MRILAVSLLALAVLAQIPGHDSARKQVLLLTGYNSTRNHDWRTLAPLLRGILEKSGEFEVRINEEPRALTADVLRGYDVLVLDYSNYTASLAPPWPEATQTAYLDFVRRGGGIVAFHAACGSFQSWPEYRKSLGIADHSRISHGPYHSFEVKLRKTADAVWKDIPTQWNVWGEIYNGMRLEPDARVVATAYDDPDNCVPGRKLCGSGKDEPVIWTYRYGQGRSVVFTPGHERKTFEAPEVAQAFIASVRWASTR